MRCFLRLAVRSCLTLAAAVAIASSAAAEPLTPLSATEVTYLDQLRRVFTQYHDPAGFRSDGELLDLGRRVCQLQAQGFVGYEATLISPAIVQLATIYLCPR